MHLQEGDHFLNGIIAMILQKTEKFNIGKLKKMDSIKEIDEKTNELISQYFNIESEYRYALRVMSAKLENLDDYCQSHFDHNPIHHMESRIKTPESILEKMVRRNYPLTFDELKKNIYDIAGIRVVCNYINDIYQIIKLLSMQKDLTLRLSKDYIIKPKDTGYRSFHLVYEVEIYMHNELKMVPVEIQFRTLAMDMWASLEHELRYKSKNSLSEKDKANLKKYSDDLYNVDLNMQRIYIATTVGDDDND